MCCGEQDLLFLGSSFVCRECGIEKRGFQTIGIENTSHNCHFEPFYNCGYSRKKRMSHMIESLFFPNASTPDEPILKLITQTAKLPSVSDVCTFLKRLPVSDKRYINLHFYCRLLLANYVAPVMKRDVFAVKKQMLHWFERIELAFLRTFSNKPFLNYGWLLRVMLDKFNLPAFKRFVKPLKCRKRIRFYAQTYKHLEGVLRFPTKVHV